MAGQAASLEEIDLWRKMDNGFVYLGVMPSSSSSVKIQHQDYYFRQKKHALCGRFPDPVVNWPSGCWRHFGPVICVGNHIQFPLPEKKYQHMRFFLPSCRFFLFWFSHTPKSQQNHGFWPVQTLRVQILPL